MYTCLLVDGYIADMVLGLREFKLPECSEGISYCGLSL